MNALNNAVRMAHKLVEPLVVKAACIVDATAGNGNDTLFLARTSGPTAVILAFDIQPQALENTKSRLRAAGLDPKVQLIHDTHANAAKYLDQSVDVVMFNLGYLPGGDHAMTTRGEETLAAVKELLLRLSFGGILAITAYPGHPAGREELACLQHFLSSLPQQLYAVYEWRSLNQINDPPVLLAVEKVGSEGIERFTPYED